MQSETRLRERKVRDAAKDLDAAALIAHLAALPAGAYTCNQLVIILARCESLLIRHPNQQRVERRTTFFEELGNYVSEAGLPDADEITRFASQLNLLEVGYKEVLDHLSADPVDPEPLAVRLAAELECAIRTYHHTRTLIASGLAKAEELTEPHTFKYEDDGEKAMVDHGIGNLVDSLTNTLLMEAHKAGLVGENGRFAFPALGTSNQAATTSAVRALTLALSWRDWSRVEKSFRYFGGTLLIEQDKHGTASWGQYADLWQYVADDGELAASLFEACAFDRLSRRIHTTELETQLDSRVQYVLGHDTALPPAAFISKQEHIGALELEEWFGVDLGSNAELFGGLRLNEWLRAYASLEASLDDIGFNDVPAADTLLRHLSKDEILSMLEGAGLARAKGELFLDAATLKATSEDLYDAPFIPHECDRFTFFTPALRNPHLARIIVSTLGRLHEHVETKGKTFEGSMLRFFQELGYKAATAKVTKGDEEFEFDVLLDWGDCIFIFECKTAGLPGRDPIAAYNFRQGIVRSVEQVQRLKSGLEQYPEILTSLFGESGLRKKVIPCVVNALPFSVPGTVRGVYFTDGSALRRFFSDPEFRVMRLHELPNGAKILHRVTFARMWAREKPQTDDLLRYFAMPWPMVPSLTYLKTRERTVPLGTESALQYTDTEPGEYSMDSVISAFGGDPDDVRAQLKGVEDFVNQVKESGDTIEDDAETSS